MSSIRLAREAESRIREHAARAYPMECCGALLGRAESDEKRVVDVLPLDNAQDSERERRFLVADDAYVRVEREADRRGLALLGFYHSHPDHPAAPSETDLAAAFPSFSNVIVAVQRGMPVSMTSWVLADDRRAFLEEPIVLDEGDS